MRYQAPARSRSIRQTLRSTRSERHGQWRCAYCGRSRPESDITIDHAIPLCRGGADNNANRVLACRECNHLKGPLTADEYMPVRHDHDQRKQLIATVHEHLRATPTRAVPIRAVHPSTRKRLIR